VRLISRNIQKKLRRIYCSIIVHVLYHASGNGERKRPVDVQVHQPSSKWFRSLINPMPSPEGYFVAEQSQQHNHMVHIHAQNINFAIFINSLNSLSTPPSLTTTDPTFLFLKILHLAIPLPNCHSCSHGPSKLLL
jgi:hypothetical protein